MSHSHKVVDGCLKTNVLQEFVNKLNMYPIRLLWGLSYIFCMSVTLEIFYIISTISVAMHIKGGGLGTQAPALPGRPAASEVQ